MFKYVILKVNWKSLTIKHPISPNLSIHLLLNVCLYPLQEALAPYQHIEQDLKSLKEVVEMKNQQIHQQEKKISDLERVVGSNQPD